MALTLPVSQRDHMQGNIDASIELVEYGDYQCPYCGKAYPIIKALQQMFGGSLKFVFRNFPLSSIHPQAKLAAVASEAAAKQDRFWEMHDIIFENQKALANDDISLFAKSIGLDELQFKNDILTKSIIEKVEEDFESGVRSGVNGTPGFFINGEKYNGPWDIEHFSAYIKDKIDFIEHDQMSL